MNLTNGYRLGWRADPVMLLWFLKGPNPVISMQLTLRSGKLHELPHFQVLSSNKK